jgi:rRNA maturation RNase YbeY
MFALCECRSPDSIGRFYAVRAGSDAVGNCTFTFRTAIAPEVCEQEPLNLMISLHSFNTHPKHKIKSRGTLFVARSVFKSENIQSAKVNIIFVNDKRIIELNNTYLNKKQHTDVLSFDLNSDGEIIEGEVYIDIDQARRQAQFYKVSYKNEYSRLIIHGILHLIGYRDGKHLEKIKMKQRENEILNQVMMFQYML